VLLLVVVVELVVVSNVVKVVIGVVAVLMVVALVGEVVVVAIVEAVAVAVDMEQDGGEVAQVMEVAQQVVVEVEVVLLEVLAVAIVSSNNSFPGFPVVRSRFMFLLSFLIDVVKVVIGPINARDRLLDYLLKPFS
jgi:hypothetical protein